MYPVNTSNVSYIRSIHCYADGRARPLPPPLPPRPPSRGGRPSTDSGEKGTANPNRDPPVGIRVFGISPTNPGLVGKIPQAGWWWKGGKPRGPGVRPEAALRDGSRQYVYAVTHNDGIGARGPIGSVPHWMVATAIPRGQCFCWSGVYGNGVIGSRHGVLFVGGGLEGGCGRW